MTTIIPRPPFDPEVEAVLAAYPMGALSLEAIPAMREQPFSPPLAEQIGDLPIDWYDVVIPGHGGGDITVSVFTKRGHTGQGPGIYHTHGGGMITGGRFDGIDMFLAWVDRYDAVLVSVEYRLAPEHQDPVPVEDCYAGLVWTAANAEELGIDPTHLIIGGGSAGGGLAAGVALLARDRGGPALAAQLLICPMIDDRDSTVSARQIDGVGLWNRSDNNVGWTALLGDRKGTDDVSIYAAPARAADLSGLPPAFIDAGSAEVFRDEDVAYASALWAAGVQAELHVWAGGFHGFDSIAAHAAVSRASVAARESWIERVMRR